MLRDECQVSEMGKMGFRFRELRFDGDLDADYKLRNVDLMFSMRSVSEQQSERSRLQPPHLARGCRNSVCLFGRVSVTGSFCLKDFLSNPYSRILRESVRMPMPQLFAVSAMLP